MFKRIMIVGVLTVSIALACLSFAAPARAAGFPDRIAKTEVPASTENGDVPLPSAKEAQNRVELDSYVMTHHHHRTPRMQAFWQMRHRYHHDWSARRQYKCLNPLWDRESSWWKYATNPYSGAYGIPQSDPADKMASAGDNWKNSSWTQIRWGLRYIRDVYGFPCAAWRHEQYYGWYIASAHEAMIKFKGKMIVKMAEHIGLPKYTGSGCPYSWGGTGPCSFGFDCSGLVYRTFHRLGQGSIPRTANDQMNWAIAIRKLIPGDLIFYGYSGYASHVAIYIGHWKVIEALDPGTDIGIYGVDYTGTPIAYGRVPFHWNPKTKF